MATASALFTIKLGTSTTVTTDLILLGSGSQGDPYAQRVLTHPDGANFSPIVYWNNPDRSFNIDNDVLRAPVNRTVLTETGTRVISLDRFEEDTIITEIWSAAEGLKFAMPTFLFRQLYEYYVNRPALSITNQEYIQWQPRDKNSNTYNVIILRLAVGGGDQNNQLFDIADFRPVGGVNDPRGNAGTIFGPLDDLDVTPTGVIDRSVVFQFKIVNTVTP